MISTGWRGSDSRGTPKSVFGPGAHGKTDRATLLGGTMGGWDARSLAQELGELRRLCPDCRNFVKHLRFALPPGEHLTDAQWLEVTEAKAIQEGWDAWFVVRHDDEPHDHVHMIASRITQDGRVIREPGFDVARTEQICREFEAKFGLRRVQSPERSAAGKKVPTERDRVLSPTHSERDMMKRTRERSSKVHYQVEILAALATKPTTWDEFRQALAARGIGLRAKVVEGEVTGISFDAPGAPPMKGRSLGTAFTGAEVNAQIEQNQEATHAASGPTGPVVGRCRRLS